MTWKSSNTKVAKVSSSGLVTGKKAGKATIKATVNGKTYKCKVTVKTSLSNKKIFKILKGKVYTKGSTTYINYYYKISEKYLITYSNSTDKVISKNKIEKLYKKGKYYRTVLNSGDSEYRFALENGKVKCLHCWYKYNGHWSYSGGSSLNLGNLWK